MSYPQLGRLTSAPCIKRHPVNPILTKAQVPYECSLTFNAGIAKYKGQYVMVFRNDFFEKEGQEDFYAGRSHTNLGIAYSQDGIKWEVGPKPILDKTIFNDKHVSRAYDPRLIVIDGRCYLCFAVDTYHGVRGGIAVTDDFEKFEILSISAPENRNMVLFPEKIGGLYYRLERPFPMYGRGRNPWEHTRFDTWISASPDLRYWGDTKLLLGVEDVPFANDKIGPAAPPVRTEKGWLTTFHSVDIDDSRGKNGWEKAWKKRYCAGLMLLDLKSPAKVIGLYKQPLIAPEATYETTGTFRDNVIFPGGMILEDNGEVKIYYGGGDAVECLATANVDDLLALCEPV